jgi:hypothetical protein
MTNDIRKQLVELRSAHTIWYVYAKEDLISILEEALNLWLKKESQLSLEVENYDFEHVMDECGFHYNEELPLLSRTKNALWKVSFE